MAGTLAHLRVFIASPGGLEEERKAFRDVIEEYNQTEARPRGVYFEPVGWEDTVSRSGWPQGLINEEVKSADYFLLLLHDRWGSDPGESSEYTSGTEEEYHLARECCTDDETPMRDMAMLFKAVPAEQQSDPGPQLQKVLDFQKGVEDRKDHLYNRFDAIERFKYWLRSYLGAWMRQEKDGTRPQPSQPEPMKVSDDAPDEQVKSSSSQVAEAWFLANAGKLTEAEVAFSKAVVGRRDPDVLLGFGRFLQRQGRLDQARAYIDEAIEAAKDQKDRKALASAYGNLGNMLQIRGELDKAEEMHRKALKLSEGLSWREGMADAYGNLGLVLSERGDLDEAEEMHRESLKIDEDLGRREGMANAYGNIALLLHKHRDLDEAESMHRKSLRINEDLGRREYIANAYGNLGRVFYERGDLDEAEEMHRESLKIDEDLGRREGIGNAYYNLGHVFEAREAFDSAEGMYRKALKIEEDLGRRRGMAANYVSLGNVFEAREGLDGAKEMYRQALKLAEQIGDASLVEEVMSLLNDLGRDDGPASAARPNDK